MNRIQNIVVAGVVVPFTVTRVMNKLDWSVDATAMCSCGNALWDCCDLGADWTNGNEPETFRFWLACRVGGGKHPAAIA